MGIGHNIGSGKEYCSKIIVNQRWDTKQKEPKFIVSLLPNSITDTSDVYLLIYLNRYIIVLIFKEGK